MLPHVKSKSCVLGVAAVVVAGTGSVSSAGLSQLGYTVENGGNTWTFGDQFVGLVGFRNTPGGVTVTADDILGDVTVGGSRITGLFNGVDNLGSSLDLGSGTIEDYESNTFFPSRLTFANGDNLPFSNDIDIFTAVTLDADNTSFISVFFVVFDGGGPVILNGGIGGTATIGTNGNLGEFPASFVPAPSSAGLLALSGLIASRRRRR